MISSEHREHQKEKREREREGSELRLFVSDHKSVLRVLVGGQELGALVEQSLDLGAGAARLLLTQDHGQHLCQLGHAVGECHQSQLVQLLQFSRPQQSTRR